MSGFLFWFCWNNLLVGFAWWLSYFFAKKIKHYAKKKNSLCQRQENREFLLLIFVGFLWLIFFPNIPYLFTEGRHLVEICEVFYFSNVDWCVRNSSWSVFLFFYSSLAIIPFTDGLWRVSTGIEQFLKIKNFGVSVSVLARFFPLIYLPICSFAVIIGLVGRFHSWEIFQVNLLFDFLKSPAFSFADFWVNFLSLVFIYYCFLAIKNFTGKF